VASKILHSYGSQFIVQRRTFRSVKPQNNEFLGICVYDCFFFWCEEMLMFVCLSISDTFCGNSLHCVGKSRGYVAQKTLCLFVCVCVCVCVCMYVCICVCHIYICWTVHCRAAGVIDHFAVVMSAAESNPPTEITLLSY
jgi:hypothetical protein